MSQYQNIQKHVANGKGSIAMLEYLIWFNQSVELELKSVRKFYSHNGKGEGYEFISLAGNIAEARRRVDVKEISKEEYQAIIESHHKYKDLVSTSR